MIPATAQAERLTFSEVIDLARRCGSKVAPFTVAAIAKTESGFRPLVVSDNDSRMSREFARADEAAAHADRLISQGHSVDIGLMQINSANLRRLGYTTGDALDACKSVAGGALILSRNYAGIRNVGNPQIALRHALSQYNTGSIRRGYVNGYVRRVEQAARSLLQVAREPKRVLRAEAAVIPRARDVVDLGWNVWLRTGGATMRPSVAPGSIMVF